MKRKTDSDEGAPSSSSGRVVRVWDLPIRLVHWALVILVALAWWTADAGQMQWHRLIGCTLAGLLVFRLWWGFFGGSTARFSSFLKGPTTVVRYALGLFGRSSKAGRPGHNPMGGWSVMALLIVLIVEVGLGLVSVDEDGLDGGPFASRVSFDMGRLAAHWHQLLFDVLLALIGLHLCAIAFYAVFKRDNLVGPMFTGRRRVEGAVESARPTSAGWFWGGTLLAGLITAFLARGS